MNCGLAFPPLFQNLLDSLKIVNMDILGSLGLECSFPRFNFLNKRKTESSCWYVTSDVVFLIRPLFFSNVSVHIMTLGPLLLIALLGMCYLVTIIKKFESKNTKAVKAQRFISYVVPTELRDLFTTSEIHHYKQLFFSIDLNNNGLVSRDELRNALNTFMPHVKDEDQDELVSEILAECSRDGDEINFDKARKIRVA
jgi:hypothetical protein